MLFHIIQHCKVSNGRSSCNMMGIVRLTLVLILLPIRPRLVTSRYNSLTPMGVRALGARMRENCNTPLTLFGYLIFHMSASSFFSSLLRMCQNLSTPSYLLISCFFYLLFNNLSRLRQFARAVINNANLRLDVRIESQFCVS